MVIRLLLLCLIATSCASKRELPPPPVVEQSFERSNKKGSMPAEDEPLPENAPTRTVTIAWDPNPEPDVIGYRVYVEDEAVEDVEDTTATLSGLDWGVSHTIAVTAYNASLESERSVPLVLAPPPLILDGVFEGSQATFALQGWPQASLDLQSSLDLTTWATLDTINLNNEGRGTYKTPIEGKREFWRILNKSHD